MERRNGELKGADEKNKGAINKKKWRGKKREEWLHERRAMKERIGKMEWANERREREKKNKIVIRGVRWRGERLEQKVEEFIKSNLKIKVGIKKASMIIQVGNGDIMVVETHSWEQKRGIMSRKELERNIIIEDDLTRREREKYSGG